MLLQIVDSVAKEEIVVGSCAVGDLLENNNATFAAGGHKPMETHSSQCRGITVDGDDEDECEERNKNGVDMFDMELKLHSPAGGESLIYKWPLVLGDERDESLEMLETIRWVCRDVPELESILGKNEVHAMFDPRSYQGMKRLCDRFNGAIDTLRQLKWISEKSPPTPSSSSSSSNYQFASTGLLKHILQVCYNRAVEEPDKLNQYEPFSPEVYGETSFELVEELTKVTKFGEDDVFIDLGSGVGQVVLQVAGSTPCKFCYGIEKSDWPAKYSEILSSEFKKWMSFFGKHHSKFRLEKGDFLSEEKSDAINSASIIFVNNFAFGPQVDHQLKLKFANVKEGARIVSSRAFCPLNFHITDRNLSDIGTIMKVEELTALPAAVSWTDKPFAYFLHTIDRSLLEKYFNDLKTNSETGSKRPVGNERTKRKFINGGSVKSESGDDVVRNKKPRKQLNGETDSGVETVGNHDKKYAKKMLDSSSGSEKRKYKLKLKKGPKKGFTMKRGRKKLNSVTLSTLDIFHRQISSGSASFDESNKVTFNDQWMLNNRSREDQITSAHLNGAVGPIRNLMTLFERQMMFFLQHMHTSAYKEELRKKLESERRKSANLSSKISDLEMEVQLLRRQGTELLTKRMNETMPQSKDGSGLLKQAGSVLVDRSNFDRQMSCLREQIIQLEHKQKQLVALQHSGSNGILPTLHDLLTSPRISLNNNNVQHNTSDRLLPNTSSAYKNVMEGRVEAESGKFSMDMGETLTTKNHKNTSSLPSSKKQPTKRMRTNNSAGSNPKPAAPRKKKIKGVEATDDHNNNKTIPSPSNKPLKLEKLPESVRTLQHVPSNDQLRSTPQTQALQSRHRPQTTKQPLNVDLQILHQQQILRHHQQLQIDQQMLNFHRGQEQLLQQHELKASEPTTHPCKKQIKLLSVAQDQQAIGHFPYKLVYNDSTDQTSSIKPQKHQMPPLPCDDTGAAPTASDKILPSQAPFLSKLTAPNFTVVDFSQLVKTGATQNSLLPSNLTPVPTLKPLPSFPLPAHIFPPPNFMLYRPPMGAAPLMSPLSKPLFSEIHPSSGSSFSSSLSSRNASFISFSSPLLSLPLFQPTNLVSTSMACSPKPVFSKLHSSSPPSSIVSSSSPAASTSLSSAEVINLDMTNSSQESSQPIMSLKQAAKLSTIAKANGIEEDAKPSGEHSLAPAGSYQQSSSSSSSSSVSSPSGKSGGSFSESIPFEDQVVGMNKFVDSRKEILASQ